MLNVAAATIGSTGTVQARSFGEESDVMCSTRGWFPAAALGGGWAVAEVDPILQNAHDALGNRQFGTNGSDHNFPLAVSVGLGYGAACSYGYGGCNGVGYGLPVDLDLGYSAACAYGPGGYGS